MFYFIFLFFFFASSLLTVCLENPHSHTGHSWKVKMFIWVCIRYQWQLLSLDQTWWLWFLSLDQTWWLCTLRIGHLNKWTIKAAVHRVCTGLFLPDCRWPSWFNWGAYPGRGKAGQTLHGEGPGWSSGNFGEDQMLWFDGKKWAHLHQLYSAPWCPFTAESFHQLSAAGKPWIPCFCGLQPLTHSRRHKMARSAPVGALFCTFTKKS